jgi:hypothetical protein
MFRSPSCVELAEPALTRRGVEAGWGFPPGAVDEWSLYVRKNRIISADASGPIGSV